MKPLRHKPCGKGRLLCAGACGQLYYHRNVFWLLRDGQLRRLCEVPRMGKHTALSRWPLFERMLRLEPRCAIALQNGAFLVSLRGGIYRLSAEGELQCEHRYRRGMNNPLTFAGICDVPGFADCIAYGEYFGNGKREPVNLWCMRDGRWQCAYTFPAQSICHIHAVVPAKEHGCVYVLTGDEDAESVIWEFRDNFSVCKKLVGGAQCFRSCVAFPWGEDLVYATDTPLEDNGVYRLNRATGDVEKLADLPGPVIYGTRKGEQMVFATSVEPDSRLKGKRYLLSYRRGYGVKTWNSFVIAGNPKRGFHPLVAGRKDLLPMTLFQFGNFLFPPTQGPELYAVGQSLKKYSGKTVNIKYE